MTMRMLIDARHREETRVSVVKGNRIEEFDFESAERKQLKGNIYLAKVTRVEPSLQAAFIDYGGNRHGFLAFSEIHPDYYQIPREDREALLREEAEHAAEEAALRAEQDADDNLEGEEGDGDDEHRDNELTEVGDDIDDEEQDADAPSATADEEEGEGSGERPRRRRRERSANDEAADALRERRMNLRRRYKIQDVIRRRQVLLVQVVKEERGNKGAALTTYLSLAGRYCVLMPNTSHGGGISRKISNAGDRKRLKSIMADLQLPPSMGCIVRTAGLQRTKVEIKRDFDYLARLWDEIREKTLSSSAPALVYGDSDLIKRAIRDIYNRDIDEVIVEGEEGYRQARDFMKLLMPSHARRVKHYSDPVPLFQRAGVEDQLSAMYHPVVQLKSGGYLVINPTEALVSIDINSGRSTREHNIEQTATATNLEATAEIARQLRLRDMAGLVVIDFIDMDHGSNVRKVEKAMKEALKNDRARIQVGRISSFGLMEMSRQRLRTGVLEASTRACPHCEGTGLVRTASSAGLSALRLLEDEAARGRGSQLLLRASHEAALYVLNRKRAELAEIEDRYGVLIEVSSDGEQEGARMAVEVSGPPPAHAPRFEAPIEDLDDEIPEDIEIEEDEDEEGDEPRASEESGEEGRGEGGKRRRRRRGRRGRTREEDEFAREQPLSGDMEPQEGRDSSEDDEEREDVTAAGEQPLGEGRRRRRRGRRGGRRSEGESSLESGGAEEAAAVPDTVVEAGDSAPVTGIQPIAEEPVVEEASAERAPRTRRRPRAREQEPAATPAEAEAPVAPVVEESPVAEAPAKPKRTRRKPATDDAAPAVEISAEAPASEEAPATAPKRRSRRKAADAPADVPGADLPIAANEDVVDAEASAAANDVAAIPLGDGLDGATPVDDAAAGPAPASQAVDPDPGEAGTPRRGWWQRTFGN